MMTKTASCRLFAVSIGTMMLAAGAAQAGAIQLQPHPGAPLADLTPEQLALFEAGKVRYSHVLSQEQGLGPGFNQSSCGSCHAAPLGGPGSQAVTRFGIVDKRGEFDPLAELGGSLLQISAIEVRGVDCLETIPNGAHTAMRVTNGALAYGLVEAIPDATLESVAALNGGVVHYVEAFEDPKGAPLRVGRFGWKAQVATILTFSADASLNEMGLTNRFLTEENAPNGDLDILALCDLVPDPEDSTSPPLGDGEREFIDLITFFQRYLAPPPQTPKSGMTGETLFNLIGCAQCHVKSFRTATTGTGASGVVDLEAALSGKTIMPYGDFMLHDMGMLGDGIVQGAGDFTLMKTPPLWGIRFRDPILHDGRVPAAGIPSTLENRIAGAVAWHNVAGSDATDSAAKFLSGYTNEDMGMTWPVVPGGLTDAQRDQVLAFLDSLGRAEFDSNGDPANVQIDYFDFLDFASCYLQGPFMADDFCAIHDPNQDGQVDLTDFEAFQTVYNGFNGDCNDNGVPDLQDILVGTSLDVDLNGIPDECVCVGDIDGNLTVNGIDLGILLSQWSIPAGSPGCGGIMPCVSDLNTDGVVDGIDLGILLSNWGPCF